VDERATLIQGAEALGVSLPADAATRLLRLLDELERWNHAYNLTSIVDRGQMLTHHLLDSLSIHGELRGTAVADVGTGAGFPGLPLAITASQRHFTLIDSGNKKVRFVAHAVRALGLANVAAVHSRVEVMRPAAPFDCVVARAFASLPDLLERIVPLCGEHTRVLAMKGRRPEEEVAAVRAPWRILETRRLQVPGLGEERHLVVLERRER
jgi:16S rRNA (guanine527-N7)-methyltransferase